MSQQASRVSQSPSELHTAQQGGRQGSTHWYLGNGLKFLLMRIVQHQSACCAGAVQAGGVHCCGHAPGLLLAVAKQGLRRGLPTVSVVSSCQSSAALLTCASSPS